MFKNFKVIVVFLTVFNLFLSSWYVIHKDLYFFTDVARDFLLYEEIDMKHLILIGPRSSTTGIFHGPLWIYLNYPAYLIGHGNPLIVGWFWIFLTAIFVLTSFYIARKIFDEKTAYAYALLLSIYMAFQTKALFNPYGALFFMPLFFYSFVKYFETSNWKYLAVNVLTAGLLIQFQMAIGIPLFALSTFASFVFILRKRKLTHVPLFLLIFIPISTYILFDIRHNFLMLHSFLSYIGPGNMSPYYHSYLDLVLERVGYIFNVGLQVFIDDPQKALNTVAFLFITVFSFIQIKSNKHKVAYLSFFYFYAGFFVLSILNKTGGLLGHYFMPLTALSLLILSSMLTSNLKKAAIVFIGIVYFTNLYSFIGFIHVQKSFTGISPDSWAFLKNLTDNVYAQGDKTFGYIVYSPDSYGYQPKYAMHYAAKTHNIPVYLDQKKPITYVVSAPRPSNQPYIGETWWIQNVANIKNAPAKVIKFPNGFKIYKYLLSDQDIAVPASPELDPGIHFR